MLPVSYEAVLGAVPEIFDRGGAVATLLSCANSSSSWQASKRRRNLRSPIASQEGKPSVLDGCRFACFSGSLLLPWTSWSNPGSLAFARWASNDWGGLKDN